MSTILDQHREVIEKCREAWAADHYRIVTDPAVIVDLASEAELVRSDYNRVHERVMKYEDAMECLRSVKEEWAERALVLIGTILGTPGPITPDALAWGQQKVAELGKED